MRSAPIILAVLLVPTLAIAPACRRREEPPPPPPPAKPVSIWNEIDSQEVAKQLVTAAGRDAWASQFRDRNSRPARISLGEIADRSGRDVPVDGFATAIRQALAASGGDRLTTSGAQDADYAVSGVIGASSGTDQNGVAVVFFAIDLSFNQVPGGDTVWHFAIERPIPLR